VSVDLSDPKSFRDDVPQGLTMTTDLRIPQAARLQGRAAVPDATFSAGLFWVTREGGGN
jgi:hypothetical protein